MSLSAPVYDPTIPSRKPPDEFVLLLSQWTQNTLENTGPSGFLDPVERLKERMIAEERLPSLVPACNSSQGPSTYYTAASEWTYLSTGTERTFYSIASSEMDTVFDPSRLGQCVCIPRVRFWEG